MSTQFPGVHSVQIYANDSCLVESVGALLATSLALGDSVLLVATSGHRDEIAAALLALRVDLPPLIEDGRYTTLDAREVMDSIMRDGMPDRCLFETGFLSMLDRLRDCAHNLNRGITVYGECVALLWEEGRKEAALQLERLWCDVFERDDSFHLHCAYPRAVFGDDLEIEAVKKAHTHVFQ
jgi:hypothetical protein